MSIEKKIARVGNLTIEYLEAGQGPDLVFLHGAGGGPAIHSVEFIELLSDSFRVLAPTLPGFDESELGECESVLDVAEAVAGFIGATCQGAAHLAGQSFGTRIACWTAIQHPELVESLVLSGPTALNELNPSQVGERPQFRPNPSEIESRLFGKAVGLSDEDHQKMARNAANAFHFKGPSAEELLARLPEVKAKVLVLVGTEDRMMAPKAPAVIQKAIPTCNLIYLHGAPHELQVAMATRWVDLVRDFLKRGEMFVVNLG
jgi:pimeloyl-ACP methyl ester carboxylesterase